MNEFSRSLAIVIGINKYQNGISPLQTAVPDSIAIATILQDTYQYQLIHPVFKSGIIVNHYATGDYLKSLFTDILPKQIKPTKSDRLLLYFAGHGIARNSDTGPEGYLVPQDGEINNPDSLLRMEDVHNWLSQLECRHLLVILDCCFAGSFRWASTRKLIGIPETIHWEHYHRFIKYPAWQVITSAAYNQEALDFLNNRDGEINKRHSPFAEGLIKALGDRQADLIADGVITTPELYLYLRDYVESNSQEKQTPGFFPLKNHDRGEYIFQLPNVEPQLQPAPKLKKNNNPYRGLESFEESHAHFFFGRQEVIQDLYTQVTHPGQQLTVVLGISGSGKSSLVKAGLIPHLRQHKANKWYILSPIRPGNDPFSSLARVLSQLNRHLQLQSPNTAILANQLQDNSSQFINCIKAWSQKYPKKRLLLIIDQFEELITLAPPITSITKPPPLTWSQKIKSKLSLSNQADPNQDVAEQIEEWHKFINLLSNILKQCPQLSLVVTLRSDFEPRFLNSTLQKKWINSRFVVRAMHSDELRDVVEKPATEMALYFEPANLVDRLVDEVAQMPGALPLLSFTLSEMYLNLHRAWLEEGQEDRALTIDPNFDSQGGVAGSLTRRANQEYNLLPDSAYRQTMSRVMLRMVEIEGGEAVKRRVSQPELIYPQEQENQRVAQVLNSLIDTRLIVTGKEAESDRIYYEPAHDFLVRGWDKLQDWLQKGQQQDNLALQRLLTLEAFDWQERGESPRFLWNANPRLNLLQEILHSKDNWFNRVEKEFVQASIGRKKINVRLRRGGAISVILLLSTGLIFALLGQRDAKISESKAFEKSARVNLTSNQSLDSMLDSLRAGKALQHRLLRLIKPRDKDQLKEQVAGTLQWSVYQVKELNRIQGDPENTVPVRSIFNPQGTLLASAEEDGRISLWNPEGEKIADWQADPQRLRNISFSPKQDLLISAAQDGKIYLWNLNGEEIANWQGHQGQVRDVSFSPDGKLITSAGGEDGTVALWNVQGKELNRWQTHNTIVKSVSFSPDGRLIATAEGDKTIRLWNLQGKLLRQFPINSWRIIFSPNGQLIASAGDDGVIKIWNRQYQQVASWKADNQRLWNVAFSPDSRLIASAGDDGSAKVWSLEDKQGSEPRLRVKQVSSFRGHTGPVRSVSFGKDGNILASSGDDGTTRLWTLQSEELSRWQGDNNSVYGAIFSPNGKLIASTGEDGKLHLWNLKGKQLAKFPRYPLSIRSISFSPNGQLIASVNQDGIVHLWGLKGKLLHTFSTQMESLETIEFSPDGQFLALAGNNGNVSIWTLPGRLLDELSEHEGAVYDLDFSPDGKLIASAGQDGNVIVWNWENPQLIDNQPPINKFPDHIGEVYTVAFSPDGTWLASGGQDSTVRRWNIEDNTTKSPLHTYQAKVTSVTYTPDGKKIISSDDQGAINLWDMDSGKSLATWKAHKATINRLSLNPEGNILATAGEGGEIKLWRIDSFEQLFSQVCSSMQDYLQNNSNVDSGDRNLCKSPILNQNKSK